jgi:hypothetical protein
MSRPAGWASAGRHRRSQEQAASPRLQLQPPPSPPPSSPPPPRLPVTGISWRERRHPAFETRPTTLFELRQRAVFATPEAVSSFSFVCSRGPRPSGDSWRSAPPRRAVRRACGSSQFLRVRVLGGFRGVRVGGTASTSSNVHCAPSSRQDLAFESPSLGSEVPGPDRQRTDHHHFFNRSRRWPASCAPRLPGGLVLGSAAVATVSAPPASLIRPRTLSSVPPALSRPLLRIDSFVGLQGEALVGAALVAILGGRRPVGR